MSKQTAVEWFLDIINNSGDLNKNEIDEMIVKAKEMEKEQIINAHVTGLIDPIIMKNYKGLSVDEIRFELTKQAEEYYNEFYKNETK